MEEEAKNDKREPMLGSQGFRLGGGGDAGTRTPDTADMSRLL